MNTCPNCGHKWKDEARASGGVARWKGVGKRKRSEAARKASLSVGKARRREIAREAVRARWDRQKAKEPAPVSSADSPAANTDPVPASNPRTP